MPFGLDLKSVIVGILIAQFLVPFIMAQISGARSRRAAPSQ